MKTYEVKDTMHQKFYFFEKIAPNHIRVFQTFEVECTACQRSRVIRAIDFTAPGHYKKFPVNRTLVFVCSMCGWESPDKVRVELV